MKYLLAFVFSFFSMVTIAQETAVGLNVGDNAPIFMGKDQKGKKQNLAKLKKTGKTVLLFYRGEWCPYCNKQLKAYQDSLQLLTANGNNIIAVTPELSENINKTIGKTKVTFPVIHDKNLKIMKQYQVNFEVDAKTIEKYKGYGIDFEKANGANGANLPVPALYIIDTNGKIIYKYFDKNYSKRPSVAELLGYLN